MTRRLSYLDADLARLDALHSRLEDTGVMFELADSEQDEPTREEGERELAALRKEIDQLEIRTLLSGEYDAREALISINAGAGGADAADWTEGLQRIYLRWAERHGYATEVYDTSYAEEAGIKSTTFAIKAPYAYGTLRGEHGTHRMVRISKYDNQGPRQTSFAMVDVLPVVQAGRPHRHPGRRDAGRCVPVQRPGRPGREHHRLGGPDHSPAYRDRGVLPERAEPDPEQGHRHGGPAVQAAGAQAGGADGQDERAAR